MQFFNNFRGYMCISKLYLSSLMSDLCVQKALEKNDAGDYFPTIGINLGSELMLIIVSEVSYLSCDLIVCDYGKITLPKDESCGE